MTTAALTLLLSLAAGVPPAPQAPAPTSSGWTLLQWVDMPAVSDEDRAAVASLPERRAALAPMWDHTAPIDVLEQVRLLLGDPKSEHFGERFWHFRGVRLRVVDEADGQIIGIVADSDVHEPEVIDPSVLPYASILQLWGGSCAQALAALGRPSWRDDGRQWVWATYAGARSAVTLVECKADVITEMHVILRELTTTSELGRFTSGTAREDAVVNGPFVAALAPGFTKAKVADPRRFWPKTLGPGQTFATLFQRLGAPHTIMGPNVAWSYAFEAQVDDGAVMRMQVNKRSRGLMVALGLDNELTALVGARFDSLAALLGPPTGTSYNDSRWSWFMGITEMRIEVTFEDEYIDKIAWVWKPPPDPAALVCREALEAMAGKPKAPLLAYNAPGSTRTHKVFLPSGLSLDASASEVVDKLGPPDDCRRDASHLEYPGLEIGFEDDRIADVRVYESYFSNRANAALKEPLFAALSAGMGPIEKLFGAPLHSDGEDAMWLFERGEDKVRVEVSIPEREQGPAPGNVRLRIARRKGIDIDGMVKGLAPSNLLESAREAFGQEQPGGYRIRWPSGIVLDRTLGGWSLELGVDDKPVIVQSGVGGPLIDVLGAPWTTAVQKLGPPFWSKVEDEHITLGWQWADDPLRRTIELICSGTTPICQRATIQGPRSE